VRASRPFDAQHAFELAWLPAGVHGLGVGRKHARVIEVRAGEPLDTGTLGTSARPPATILPARA
jgi:hypothetical protein